MSNPNKVGIAGLTDDKSVDVSRALPEIGVLFKGAPKKPHKSKKDKQGKPLMIQGNDLDYFRLELKPEYEHLRQDFIDIYGDKPTEFHNVQFFLDDVDDCFMTAWESWDAAQTLLHRCDGVRQHRWYDKQRGDWGTARIACRDVCRKMQAGDANKQELREACRRVGRLKVLLMEFHLLTGAYGYFRFETGSIHDIKYLYNGLHLLQKQFGRLTDIPFVLGRSKRPVSTPMGKDNNGDVKRGKTIKSLMYIHPTKDFVKEVLLKPAQRVQRLTAGEAAKALGSGSTRRVGADNPHDTVTGATVVVGAHLTNDMAQEQFTDDITHIETRLTAKEQRYYVLDGLTLWTRQPIRDLFTDTDMDGFDIVLEAVGIHALPDPLRAAFRIVEYVGEMGERAERRELLRLHRIKSGQTVEVKARPANAPSTVTGDTIAGDVLLVVAAWDTLSPDQQDSITEDEFWSSAYIALRQDPTLTPELLVEAVRTALA